MSSGIRVSEEAIQQYKCLQSKQGVYSKDSENKWIIFYIPDLEENKDTPSPYQTDPKEQAEKKTNIKEIQIWRRGEGIAELKQELDAVKCNRYFVYDLPHFGEKNYGGVVLAQTNKEGYKVKAKMIYSSTYAAVKSAFSSVKRSGNIDIEEPGVTIEALESLF